ncbi:hypothetical protein PHYBOEH_011466 [Phytophthora boehmeriae]|uniref:RxLR effector protein n=1 Tax=Phytophthora boehmeriae TaxID=109152 RepID=A0A8T1WY95_9STRA|nr:hypothetical protein PHYBOEH_011466 [Phytophthora boehmeriae]
MRAHVFVLVAIATLLTSVDSLSTTTASEKRILTKVSPGVPTTVDLFDQGETGSKKLLRVNNAIEDDEDNEEESEERAIMDITKLTKPLAKFRPQKKMNINKAVKKWLDADMTPTAVLNEMQLARLSPDTQWALYTRFLTMYKTRNVVA